MGFAGLEAAAGDAKSLKVNSIEPTPASVRQILNAVPVNPYPLLKAAYGNRPMVKATAPVTVPATTTTAVPVPPGVPAGAVVAGG